MVSITRAIAAAAAVTAAAVLSLALAPTAESASKCGSTPYSYAGIQTPIATHGVRARLAAVRTPRVAVGHVAGWVGVGGPGEGRNGSDAWLQVGINSLPGTGNRVYSEAWIPGHGLAYKELGTIPTGTEIDVAVLAVAGKPGTWRAWINGQPVTAPIQLPGSERGWQADAVAESWTGGRPACNEYAYSFADLAYATSPGGGWKKVSDWLTLQDPGHRFIKRGSGFLATSR